MNRPDPAAVAEDTQRDWKPLGEMNIDELAAARAYWQGEAQYAQGMKGAVDQELWRRAREANPGVETAGTASLAGEAVVANVGASRTWEWHKEPLMALQRQCACGKDYDDHTPALAGRACSPGQEGEYFRSMFTDGEYGDLVSWEPKVDGRYFLTLMKRGGETAAALERCRSLKSATPTIDVKARS